MAADLIAGFEWCDVEANGIRIRVAIGGSGPPLLLLHGHPQTHVTWHKVAPVLAGRFTVVAPDLRGYGDSAKPGGGTDHVAYSKRVMAADQVAVMQGLGFVGRFSAIGHDRGGRVLHRMALDRPDVLDRIVLLDIAPTATMYALTDMAFARSYFWWFFLIQPFDLPERLIGADPDHFLERHLAGQVKTAGAIEPWVMEEYRRCYRDPAMRHAACEDYRAAAGIDLEHDAADATARIVAPVMALWGSRGTVGRAYDVPGTWREKAVDVRGHAIDCGHLIQEEQPAALLEACDDFL